MKTQGSEYPNIERLQGSIIVPYNVTPFTGDDSDGYRYGLIYHAQCVPADDLDYWKKQVIKVLQSELQSHIYSAYDPGTQTTVSAYMARAIALNRQDIISECAAVQEWIDGVLAYYDERKSLIETADSEVGLTGVTWDFAGDVPCHNRKDWRDIKTMFDEEGGVS